jgi:voltage-gated potassium channel
MTDQGPNRDEQTVYPPGMNELSTAVERKLEVPMLIAAALTVPMVAIHESHPGGALETAAGILNWATWLAFVFELVAMLAVVPDRGLWLRRNPLDLVLVVFTPPVLPPGLQGLRVLRLLRLARLLELKSLSRNLFTLRGVHYAAILALLTVVGGGALFDALESNQQHLSTWDGIYWALTTMTTLGSSIQPTDTGGQIVGIVLVLVGLGFIALVTGAIARRFFGPELSRVEQELEGEISSAEEIAQRELRSIRDQLAALEVAVERIVSDRASSP